MGLRIRSRHTRAGGWLRIAAVSAVLALALDAFAAAPGKAAPSDCPAFGFNDNNVDYLDPSAFKQSRIRGIESNHLNEGVEQLRRGQSTANVGGDLRFILQIIPNHHRAMYALMRLALREKTAAPRETEPYTTVCWLERATVYNPNDGKSFLIYGVYLGRLDRTDDAIAALERADALMPGDLNVAYNLGLMHFDRKDYARSMEYARRAYGGGFELQGLRQKLVQAGHWRD